MVDVKSELGPEYDAIVGELMASGNYSTKEEVLRDALRRLLEDRRAYARKLAQVYDVIDQAEASGPVTPFDRDAFFARKRAERA